MRKIFISPQYSGEDHGEGGIRRVVEAQNKYLPSVGYEVVTSEAEADIIAVHGGMVVDSNKPTVNHCHGMYWSDYIWPKFAADINQRVVRSIRRADLATAPSRWVADVIKRAMWIDPLIAYSGVDLEDFNMIPHSGYVLWNKTRVDPICDPETLNRLAKAAPDVQFVSTFGGEAANVTLTGKVPYGDAKKLVQESMVYLCSARETFGIGTLEAMASGVPVLAWDFAGQREIITHKVDGYLARDFEDLLVGLRYCIENRGKMRLEARQKVVQQFQWKDRIKDYAAAYDLVKGEDRKVSVVIPCYNLGRYLAQAVNSCSEADEVIIVDDASTDDSLEIAQSLVSEKVKLVKNGLNQYLAKTLNIGIGAASHDYIVPLDADNWLEPGAIETWRKALDQDRDIDIAYGSLRSFNEDGSLDTKFAPDGISKWPPNEFVYDQQMRFPFSGVPSTSMYRRKAWKTARGYRSRYRTGEDADFWCRLSTLGYIPKKVTEAVTLNYRQRVDSMSRIEVKEDWTKWYSEIKATAVGKPVNIVMGEPLVSVVIYGKGDDVDTIDSIWSQSLRLWEIVQDVREARGRFIYLIKAGDYIGRGTLEQLVSVIGDGFASSECKDPQGAFIDCSGLMYPRSFDAGWKSDIDFMFQLCSKLCGTVATGSSFTRGPNLEFKGIGIPEEWKEFKMACGACGGKTPMMILSQLGERPSGDMVLLAYTNVQEGVRTYRGKATNNQYRFSTDKGHDQQYVHTNDVASLLATGLFKKVEDLVPA